MASIHNATATTLVYDQEGHRIDPGETVTGSPDQTTRDLAKAGHLIIHQKPANEAGEKKETSR